jgi:hypothetical protein
VVLVPYGVLLVQSSMLVFGLHHGLLLFGGYSLLVGLYNLVPLSPRSDGSKLLTLWKNDASWQRQSAVVELMSVMMQGTRPRNWDPAVLHRALATPDKSALECPIQLYAYAQALDQHELARAMQHLHQAPELRPLAPPQLRQHLWRGQRPIALPCSPTSRTMPSAGSSMPSKCSR